SVFVVTAFYVIQNHPAYIPRGQAGIRRPGRARPARALGKLSWPVAPSPRASGGTRRTRPGCTSVRRRIRAPDRGCSSSLPWVFAVLVAAGGPAGGDCQERPEGVSAGNAQHS